MWSAIGELIFTVVVGYMGAIELFFVAKQLFHLAFQHQRRQTLLADDNDLRELQERVDREIEEAAHKEILGFNAMKDGVLYKDGFRIDPNEINDHEKLQRQDSNKIKSDQSPSIDRTENITKKVSEVTSESEEKREVIEEPCIKKIVSPRGSTRPRTDEGHSDDDGKSTVVQSVKTQMGQTNLEEFIPPSVSEGRADDGERAVHKQSSPLETESYSEEYRREEPEGQDVPEPQYSDDYLRSLDGIKPLRPILRDDGTRRRRAFKKRRSSDSTSSRESRASREEELKMFTSLEEEEFESIRRGDSDYVPIKYSSDDNLLKAGKHQRRHKKSPIKDSKQSETDDENKSSLQMLDEENSTPWGDVVHEHYKDSAFWKREKATSIEEETDENAPSLHQEDIEKQQAAELSTSPSPTKNMPQFSSFEEATHSQHQNVVSTLSKQKSKDEANKSSEKDVQKVSSTSLQYEADLQGVLSEQKPSAGTENVVACDQEKDDSQQSTTLRRSPRLDDIDRYEERLREEDENAKVRDTSPSTQSPANYNKLKSPQLTEPYTDKARAGSAKLSPSPTMDVRRSISPPREFSSRRTPLIEVIRTTETREPGSLLEGVSDFYDFNASINPSRSPSRERSLRLCISPIKSHSPPLIVEEKTKPEIPPFVFSNLLGLSSFFDFCVLMNQHAYGTGGARSHEPHRSSTDYLEAKLKARKSKSKSPSRMLSAPKNGVASLPETGGGTESCNYIDSSFNSHMSPEELAHYSKNPLYTASTPIETPETPEFQRSFSANMRYLEEMKDEYRTNAFKRSTYVGESMDFSNDFEELREKMRNFKRSQSKSRSPLLYDEMEPCTSSRAHQRELQDKILEEITRTTINYQDFSRDSNQAFIDAERRGSDSALLQNPETIEIGDDMRGKIKYTDEEMMEKLEDEEYHHFRRFSLNLNQEEQYPDDNDCIYLEQIYVQTKTGSRSWIRQDFYDNNDANHTEIETVQVSSTSVEITDDDSDHAEIEEVDSESEDDRQTVVEVDDEIDEDVFDYERQEEQSNEISECEEADREIDKYANKNANDWNDEEATGGFLTNCEKSEDESLTIDQMYNDVVKNIEVSGIEKDYENIVEAIKEEELFSYDSTENRDVSSAKTDDLLDEILRQDETRTMSRSPRRDYAASLDFINHEISPAAKTVQINSTRLRSRYRLGPAIVHRDYDDLEDINVDLNYKPKREYKWRKNFKLDDDDKNCDGSELNENQNCENGDVMLEDSEINQPLEANVTETTSKMTANETYENGDSLTESYRAEDDAKLSHKAAANTDYSKGAVKKQKLESNGNVDRIVENGKESIPDEDELQYSKDIEAGKSKKKKSKRRTRRGSKASIGNNDDFFEGVSPKNDENKEPDVENGLKKKPKRKKKSLEAFSPPAALETYTLIGESSLKPMENSTLASKMKSPTLSQTDALMKTANLQFNNKSLSPSSAKSPSPASVSRTPNIQMLEKLPEASKTAVHLTAADTSDATPAASKSRSPEPAANNGPVNIRPATSPRPQLERNDSSGVYELIKDGSMYPWF